MSDELTPQQQRELDAIDRALTGRAVDPDLADIAALANELHEARATPSPEYASRLDNQAADGSARGPRSRAGDGPGCGSPYPRRRPRQPSWWP